MSDYNTKRNNILLSYNYFDNYEKNGIDNHGCILLDECCYGTGKQG